MLNISKMELLCLTELLVKNRHMSPFYSLLLLALLLML